MNIQHVVKNSKAHFLKFPYQYTNHNKPVRQSLNSIRAILNSSYMKVDDVEIPISESKLKSAMECVRNYMGIC